MIKTLLLFLLMLFGITIIHEFGHFIMAKVFNVYVYEFSVGMGNKLFGFKGKETEYNFRMLPIGGYVKLAGEDDENLDEETKSIQVDPNRRLNAIHPIKRIIIMSAGVIMNFVLAIVIMSIAFLNIGVGQKAPEAIIQTVKEDYPAYKAGIKPNDKIIGASYDSTGYSMSINGFDELSSFLDIYDGNGNITLNVDRNGELLDVKIKPVLDESTNSYVIGITSAPYELIEINIKNCVPYACNYLKQAMKLILVTFIGLFRGVGFNNLSGPVGIYQVTEEAVSYGFASYLSLISIISLNIGIFNLLPLPIFDGGKILLTVIEMIVGHPLNKRIEYIINSASLILLLFLFVFVTFKDIFNLFG